MQSAPFSKKTSPTYDDISRKRQKRHVSPDQPISDKAAAHWTNWD